MGNGRNVPPHTTFRADFIEDGESVSTPLYENPPYQGCGTSKGDVIIYPLLHYRVGWGWMEPLARVTLCLTVKTTFLLSASRVVATHSSADCDREGERARNEPQDPKGTWGSLARA